MEKKECKMTIDIGTISKCGDFISVNEILSEYEIYKKISTDKFYLIPKMVKNEIKKMPIIIATTETKDGIDFIVKTNYIPYDLSVGSEFRNIYNNFSETNFEKNRNYIKSEKPLFMEIKSAILKIFNHNYDLNKESDEK